MPAAAAAIAMAAAAGRWSCSARGMQNMNDTSKRPLLAVLVWVLGCVFWNVLGVVLQARGQPGIGPTASLGIAAGIALVGILLWFTETRMPLLFGMLSALCAAAAIIPVYQAVTGDPSLWPSAFWRWAGAALNGFGFIAATLAALGSFRKRPQ